MFDARVARPKYVPPPRRANRPSTKAGKLIAPQHFGLTQIASSLYVEVDADEATRARLREAMTQAESAIRAAYGSAHERPIVNACISEAPEYSEAHWQGLIASNAPRPTPDELRTFKTLKQWLAAAGTQGLLALIARLNKGEDFDSVYQTAHHPSMPRAASGGR